MDPKVYADELTDVRWITKRLSILARDMYLCVQCHSNADLQVHHIYYINGHHAWDYPKKALITLCDNCHRQWHNTHELVFRDKPWCKNEAYVATKIRDRARARKVRTAKKVKKKSKGLKVPRSKLKHARKLY